MTTSLAALIAGRRNATIPPPPPSRPAAPAATTAGRGPIVPPPVPGRGLPRPPPVLAQRAKLPPPPPLPARIAHLAAANVPQSTALGYKSAVEVLAALIEFVPTFFVPINHVAALLPDDVRVLVKQRGKLVHFFKRYSFYFDVRLVDGMRYEVRLQESLQHPKRGSADVKFTVTDIGEVVTYTVKPEFVQTFDNIDVKSNDVNTNVRPDQPPPAIYIRLEERVPVLERLKALVPQTEFIPIETLEERVPEDIIFHPYFDCQGGLVAVCAKFPDIFQVVDGAVRLKPRHLAPLATDELTFDNSPVPEVIGKVREIVAVHDIPVWVSITLIYEQLTPAHRREIKTKFKSFASCLRAHGAVLAVSNDLLKVSKWIVPKVANEPNAADAMKFTHTHIVNELFDKFPRNKTLTLAATLKLIPESMKVSLPKNMAQWLKAQSTYFIVDGADIPGELDPMKVTIRRASDRAALDLALMLYPAIPDDGVAAKVLISQLADAERKTVEQIGLSNIVDNLSDWLQLLDGDVFRTKTMAELEKAIASEVARRRGGDEEDDIEVGDADGGEDGAAEGGGGATTVQPPH